MRRSSRSLLSALVLMLFASPAMATLRNPQIAVQGTALQQLFNSKGETLNVNTAQVYMISFNGTQQPVANFAPSLQLGAGALELVYAGDQNLPALEVLPAGLPSGWYSYVSFINLGTVGVSLFDDSDVLQSHNQHSFPAFKLMLAVRDEHGRFYGMDVYNPGDATHLLAYPGTGPYEGSAWLALESDGDGDYADAVFLLDGGWFTPVERTSWATLKQRFR